MMPAISRGLSEIRFLLGAMTRNPILYLGVIVKVVAKGLSKLPRQPVAGNSLSLQGNSLVQGKRKASCLPLSWQTLLH